MCVYEVNLIGIISPLLNIYICMYLLYDILIYIIHTNLFFPNLMCEMIECHVLIVLVVMLTLVDNTNAMANNRIILLRMLQQLLTCALAVWSIIFAQYVRDNSIACFININCNLPSGYNGHLCAFFFFKIYTSESLGKY